MNNMLVSLPMTPAMTSFAGTERPKREASGEPQKSSLSRVKPKSVRLSQRTEARRLNRLAQEQAFRAEEFFRLNSGWSV